ncbi:putative O-glycosylation ligase, exosortase A system-associated [Magnetospirillum molischianum]|uniref:Putative Wzy family polymerase, exosortase system type 1 associated n=1 Tax=Magnetospirillum molischianum DSM 120 TaxID=1150626 RepID=H8FQB7_MAGML|nr:putative O-glycosylation ligase, exosortase A system-associated [Magnetospirillum molischianum]CCG40555.1 putative Wzy family polymerase, exosortase system type 1 associated [Magnetospirillum molischianum DSM 120]
MRSLLMLAVYATFLLVGVRAPFVLGLGYVWTDLFQPHHIGYSIITDLPVSMIMSVATIGGYLLLDRVSPPRLTWGLKLLLLWAGWVTLTTTWAVVPGPAWEKWDWAFKTVCFGAFIPFLFRSRIQIESLLLVVLFSAAGSMIAFGIKTVISGGGYGMNLGLGSGNVGLAESSTLSMVAVALIPLILFLKTHSLIAPNSRWRPLAFNGMVAFALLTSLGTFARTGLVCMGVLALTLWWHSKRKVLFLLLVAGIGSVAMVIMSDQWVSRMGTISAPAKESSAAVRLGVWKWTLDYVASHPLGGGFGMYRINSFTVPIEGSDEVMVQTARAFHSIYFEVLGEHGYVGAAIFLSLIIYHFRNLHRLSREMDGHESLQWSSDLSRALSVSTLIYLCGGSFVGIAFQPILYIFIAVGISVQQNVERTERHAVRKQTVNDRSVTVKSPG